MIIDYEINETMKNLLCDKPNQKNIYILRECDKIR